uniref:Uncharacterized protein n=1 Tax=Anguilla anguilla TaxID=7936 RepID=A0A0E9SE25_ANGAN
MKRQTRKNPFPPLRATIKMFKISFLGHALDTPNTFSSDCAELLRRDVDKKRNVSTM